MEQEQHFFQSEAAELLKMMIHSVYSNKDIFLRELISNASDALDKRRIEVLSNSEYGEYEPRIRLVRSREENTLTIIDCGIGMTREEIVQYIGTIAKSGTREFLSAAKEKRESGGGIPTQEMLIGQFGVGFYSAFMVADRVELISRRLGASDAWKFESAGDGSYTLEKTVLPECGTLVKLHLREHAGESSDDSSPGFSPKNEKDYTDEWTLRDIVKKYSDFISYPIVMNCSKWKDKTETIEDEVINSQKAIWCKAESEVPEDEYREFYRHLTHDWHEPLERVTINAEGAANFRGLLFIPSQAPFDLFINRESGGVSLYIKRVFIMNDCKVLIPEYLRFVRGVVDSEDLPLNISREILQEDPQVRVIRRSVLRKLFASLRKMLESERGKYEKFWKAFGKVFKEGLVHDHENGQTLLELSLFRSTDEFSGEEEKWTTLDAYKSRMKPGQKTICYLLGRDISVLRGSPKLEAFRAKGYEVLLLTDPVDEVIMTQTREYGGTEFLDAGGPAGAESEEERGESEKKLEGLKEDFAPLKEKIMQILGPVLSDARLSLRMTSSPVCLVGDENVMSLQMEQLMRAMGQEVPPIKRVLEVNPDHPVIRRLMTLARSGDCRTEDFISVLYDQAVILDGGAIADPARFARLFAGIMGSALEADKA
ncbi:MAG: molecular chaperone HtpG [Synergistaceae bacterium]|jgi:molecular chaperone HtpG|nr:molecular chaperone HtpG [Synergistaceae bacterium]